MLDEPTIRNIDRIAAGVESLTERVSAIERLVQESRQPEDPAKLPFDPDRELEAAKKDDSNEETNTILREIHDLLIQYIATRDD